MSNQISEAFKSIDALRQEQRDRAYDAARRRIAGQEPVLSLESAPSKYPRSVVVLVSLLCAIFLAFAFIPSAQRLHAVAFETNESIEGVGSDVPSVYVAAFATVLMAEIGQVLFSLAAATIDAQRKRIWRIALPSALTVASYICLAIALSGNAVAMGEAALANAIAFLETFAPPVLVLIAANVLKAQMLNAVQARHAAQTQYAIALERWQDAYANAERNPAWERTLANCIRDALRDANKGKKAILRSLTAQDWVALVMRERKSEEWWDAAQTQTQSQHANGTQSTVATGEAANATTLHVDGAFAKVCPVCNEQFVGDTKRQATNRLAAHLKKHRNQERNAQGGANAQAYENGYREGEAMNG